jgi:N-acetylglucosamine-6-phosphate deacetylase
MASMLLKDVRFPVIAPDLTYGSILIEDGLIAGLGDVGELGVRDVVNGTGLTVVPGFIDVHIHGAVGVDVNEADAEGLMAVAAFLARNGVTAWLPTLVPDSDENYRRVVDAIDKLVEIQDGRPVARAIGVHYEGVFANEKMCGALRPEYFKAFTGGELSGLPRPRSGVCMMTFAPEVAGGVELASELTRQGWIASIGHTRADTETLDRAFAAGARHLTHFFNAMTGLHHRDVGVAGWALINHEATFDIIADGIHVNPGMLEFACRSKGVDKVSLISDSVAPSGLGDGDFSLWNEKVTVTGGRTRNERGSIAGSVISMMDAFKRVRSLGFSLSESSAMASANPARLIGVEGDCGSIEAGKRADLVVLDRDENIKAVLVGGRLAFGSLVG